MRRGAELWRAGHRCSSETLSKLRAQVADLLSLSWNQCVSGILKILQCFPLKQLKGPALARTTILKELVSDDALSVCALISTHKEAYCAHRKQAEI